MALALAGVIVWFAYLRPGAPAERERSAPLPEAAAPASAPAPAFAPPPAPAPPRESNASNYVPAPPRARFPVSGSVIDAVDSTPVAGVEVVFADPVPGTSAAGRAVTDDFGHFEAELAGERWFAGGLVHVWVSAGGDAPVLFNGLARLDPEIELVASGVVELRGTVLIDPALAPSEVRVTVLAPEARVDLHPPPLAHVEAGVDGWFETSVRLAQPSTELALGIEVGDELATTVPVALADLASPRGARIEITAAELAVRAVDAARAPVRDAEVWSVPLDRPPQRAATRLLPGEDGTARAQLATGRVAVWVRAPGRRMRMLEVDLAPPGVERELVLEDALPGDEIFGYAQTEDGRPAARAQVTLVPRGPFAALEDPLQLRTRSGEDGAFSLEASDALEYELSALREGGATCEPLAARVDGRPEVLVLAQPARLVLEPQTDALPGPFRSGAAEYAIRDRRTGRIVHEATRELPVWDDHVLAGEHDVFLVLPGFDGCGEAFASVSPGRTERVVVPMRAAHWIEGRVIDAAGQGVAGLAVVAHGIWPPAVEELLCSARTGLDGSFRALAASSQCELSVRGPSGELDRRPARAGEAIEIALP